MYNILLNIPTQILTVISVLWKCGKPKHFPRGCAETLGVRGLPLHKLNTRFLHPKPTIRILVEMQAQHPTQQLSMRFQQTTCKYGSWHWPAEGPLSQSILPLRSRSPLRRLRLSPDLPGVKGSAVSAGGGNTTKFTSFIYFKKAADFHCPAASISANEQPLRRMSSACPLRKSCVP